MGEQGCGFSLAEIAAYIDAELVGGSSDFVVSGLASLASAEATDISFVTSAKYLKLASQSSAGVLICPPGLLQPTERLSLLVHPQPYLAYALLTRLFAQPQPSPASVSELACISPDAEIGESVHIGPYTVVEAGAKIGGGTVIGPGCFIGRGSELGTNCQLFPNVTIYHEVLIGNDCRINSGTVIGSDGFGFAPSDNGWVKIHQLGRVLIGDRVDIGANVSIARGALDDTIIGSGVIIDDLVLIAHNVEIGDHTALAGQIGIAGSTVIGKNCTMGGQAAITGHVVIEDNVHLNGNSMVTRSLKSGAYASGMPAMPLKDWRRNTVRLRQIEKLADRVTALEKENNYKVKN